MVHVVDYLDKLPKPALIVLGLAIVLLIGLIDHITGPELFVSIFYLIPIFLVTWFTERWAGVVISIASGLTWLTADFTSGHIYSNSAIPYWNAAVRTSTFLFMALVLTALKKALKHEQERARTDSLTGIPNGRYFIELAEIEINRARRYKHPFSVVYIDLDNFKRINDEFGHSSGDRLLCSLANAIRRNIRASDTVARLGGDEFTILLPETRSNSAEAIIEKIHKVSHEILKKNGWPVTLSMGVATFISSPSSVDEMLRAADDVMYSAKKAGKGGVNYKVFDKPEASSH